MWTCFVFVNHSAAIETRERYMIQQLAPSFCAWTNFSGPSPDFNFQFSPVFNFSERAIKWSCHGWGGWSPVLHVQCTVQGQLPPLQCVMPRLRPDNEPHNNWVSHFDCSEEISGARLGGQTLAALCKDRWHNTLAKRKNQGSLILCGSMLEVWKVWNWFEKCVKCANLSKTTLMVPWEYWN